MTDPQPVTQRGPEWRRQSDDEWTYSNPPTTVTATPDPRNRLGETVIHYTAGDRRGVVVFDASGRISNAWMGHVDAAHTRLLSSLDDLPEGVLQAALHAYYRTLI